MHKRDLLKWSLHGAALGLSGAARAQNNPAPMGGPTLLTISGQIGQSNRGPLDPAFDQLMDKQQVKFQSAYVFDFAALTALPAKHIRPTLEYDEKQHNVRGPLIVDVLKACGTTVTPGQSLLIRGIDGYAVALPASDAIDRNYLIATHLDSRPLTLGSLGPLWTMYDADAVAENAAKSLKERYMLCPWGTYHIEVMA